MKKNFLTIVILVGVIATEMQAQTTNEESRDHYTTKLVGQFIAFDANLGALNTGFGYGFQLDGFVGKRLSAAAVYSQIPMRVMQITLKPLMPIKGLIRLDIFNLMSVSI